MICIDSKIRNKFREKLEPRILKLSSEIAVLQVTEWFLIVEKSGLERESKPTTTNKLNRQTNKFINQRTVKQRTK